MLDPRAVATLGIGYSPPVLARLGLWPVDQVELPQSSGGTATLVRPRVKPYRSAVAHVSSAAVFTRGGRCLASGGAGVIAPIAHVTSTAGHAYATGLASAAVGSASILLQAGILHSPVATGVAYPARAALTHISGSIRSTGIQNPTDEELLLLLLGL